MMLNHNRSGMSIISCMIALMINAILLIYAMRVLTWIMHEYKSVSARVQTNIEMHAACDAFARDIMTNAQRVELPDAHTCIIVPKNQNDQTPIIWRIHNHLLSRKHRRATSVVARQVSGSFTEEQSGYTCQLTSLNNTLKNTVCITTQLRAYNHGT